MDGRWRSDGDDDGDDLLQFPVPGGCKNRVSGAVSWNLVVVVEQNSFWKNVDPAEFLGHKATYRQRGRPRGSLGWPDHPLARPGLARAARWCGLGPAPLRLVFWLRESSGEIGFLAYFPGFFLIVDFLHKN